MSYKTRVTQNPVIVDRVEPAAYTKKVEDGDVLAQEQLDFYAKNGYLALSDLFDESEINFLVNHANQLKKSDQWKGKKEVITEPQSGDIRSIFAIHETDEKFSRLICDKRLLKIAKILLGSDVYIHQSRINYKPGFRGKEFYWHSDFETWHAEDGMPKMRAVSCALALDDNNEFNGPLMLVSQSHKKFIPCQGATPENHHEQSLKKQEYGVPSDEAISDMVKQHGIVAPKGKAGSVIFFECNILHGSNSNITPYPRANIFFVYNSVDNVLQKPFAAEKPRPNYIANRTNFSAIKES